MAKKKVNKTAAIVAEYAKNPEAKPRDIAAALNKKGLDVTSAYVSTIKASRKRDGKPLGEAVASAPPSFKKKTGKDAISLEELQAAKNLADELGGIDQASRVLDALRKLR